MKPSHTIALLVFCILAFSGVSGCTTTSADGAAGGGIRDVTPSMAEEKTHLDIALTDLEVLAGEGFENITGMEVVTLSGTDVAPAGNASTWALGIRQDGKPSFLVYSHGTWSRLNWNHPLDGGEISMDAALMPRDLYEMHADEIKGIGPETDLTLMNGTYTIRSHAPTPETLSFDAQTGEVV
ncbi:MAG: hypothetical protein PHP59_11615 [Methanofollis sp.]|uniref:hypothetical protein n=1 Tax=Methanofollis sp. TaxID=2052835 RepID=UPI0026043040|nr:hypothetical protein [Methanofollis sp.]MDD4256006.1 hypothetical protein [Methanofollis sp.]